MNELQFVLSTDLSGIPSEIEFNYEDLRNALPELLEPYKNLVVTADSVKSAKGDKAKLNKLRTAIEEQRKAIKKQCLSPYEAFEPKCKEITGLIDEAIQAIDRQVKAFSEEEKKQKYAELFAWFAKRNELDFVNIKSVLNPKWANKGEKLEKLEAEMDENLKVIEADYAMICEMYNESPLLPAIKRTFQQTLNKAETLAYAVELERRAKEEEEQRQQETLRATQQTAEQPGHVQAVTYPETVAEPYREPEGTVRSDEMQSVTFTVTARASEAGKIIQLRDFMKSLGLEFKVIR